MKRLITSAGLAVLGKPQPRPVRPVITMVEQHAARRKRRRAVRTTAKKSKSSANGRSSGAGGTSSGSGEGSDESGDDGDGEPATSAAIPLEWWQVSVLAASLATLLAFVFYLCFFPLNRFCPPFLLVTFAASFCVVMYFNPEFAFLRLSVISLWALITLSKVPTASCSATVILGMATICFGLLHAWMGFKGKRFAKRR
jgi:hypothetical protein